MGRLNDHETVMCTLQLSFRQPTPRFVASGRADAMLGGERMLGSEDRARLAPKAGALESADQCGVSIIAAVRRDASSKSSRRRST